MGFKITLTRPEGLANAKELIDSAIMAGGQEATTLVNNTAVDKAPRKYGTLKRSIHPEVDMSMGKFTGKVIQDQTVASYGRYVEEGTGIYGPYGTPIVPVNKPFLAWKGANGWIRAKSVKGMKPRPYMKPALEENQDKIKEIMQERINQALEGVK